MKSGNLNFLEPSGPLQVCNGTALPSEILSHLVLNFFCILNFVPSSRTLILKKPKSLVDDKQEYVLRFLLLQQLWQEWSYASNVGIIACALQNMQRQVSAQIKVYVTRKVTRKNNSGNFVATFRIFVANKPVTYIQITGSTYIYWPRAYVGMFLHL